MTTPRIKELVIEYHKLFNANIVNEKGMKPHTSGEWVEQSLTEAYQAGIDEAVQVLENAKSFTVSDENGVWTDDPAIETGYHQALDDTIKALRGK